MGNNVTELEEISICPECDYRYFEVVETHSEGIRCRCASCGWEDTTVSQEQQDMSTLEELTNEERLDAFCELVASKVTAPTPEQQAWIRAEKEADALFRCIDALGEIGDVAAQTEALEWLTKLYRRQAPVIMGDKPRKEQVRPFEETLSVFTVIKRFFWPDRNKGVSKS